jgi:hypothetical protein
MPRVIRRGLIPSFARTAAPSPMCKRPRHNIRDSNGKLISKHKLSPEFRCKYIEWRKSRLALLPSTRKRDRGWYESLPWSQWLSDGIVETDKVPTMRTLAHIYDNAKVDSPNIGRNCALQGPMCAGIRCKDYPISYGLVSFTCCSCVVRGRRDNPEAPEKSHRRLQCRSPSFRCDRCSPRDRSVAAPRSG